jgi:purine-binding chemotaxis protein CheW
LVVLDYNGTQIGILVDAVDQMIEIPIDTIMPMPVQNEQKLVSGMCTIPDGSGTMLELDCAQLIAP